MSLDAAPSVMLYRFSKVNHVLDAKLVRSLFAQRGFQASADADLFAPAMVGLTGPRLSCTLTLSVNVTSVAQGQRPRSSLLFERSAFDAATTIARR